MELKGHHQGRPPGLPPNAPRLAYTRLPPLHQTIFRDDAIEAARLSREGAGPLSSIPNFSPDYFTVMASRPVDPLAPTFSELRSRNEETRLRASYDLRNLVITAHRGKRRQYRCRCMS